MVLRAEQGEHDVRRGAGWRTFAGAAGVALILLLVGVVALLGRAAIARDAALSRERHSYEVLLLTAGLSGSIGRAEAALGRFVVLPTNRDFGTVYYNEWIAAGRQLDQLRRVTIRDGARHDQALALAALFEQRGRDLAAPAGHANYRQYLSALTSYNEAGKQGTVKALARALATLDADEQATLAARDRATRGAIARVDRLARLLSALGLSVVGLALALGWSTFAALTEQARARDAADLETDRADWLEVAVDERTAALTAANERLHAEMEERAAAELQLRQVQKMEAVGQLTGGIAHDFNNMLAVVVNGLEVARKRLDDEVAEVGRHMDHAMEGASRAAALTRRLMSFARAEPLLPRATDPGRLIGELTDMLDRTLGERIVLTTRGLAGVWPVWADGHQLENAILNLAVNARDAMDGEGRLLINATNMTLAAGEVGQAPAGDYVCITVVDDGCGMAPDVVERALEPFFTTKPVGKGTGLGLSQIFGFVRQSAGEIAIDSTPGHGTAVSLYLPRHVAGATHEAAPVNAPVPLPVAPARAPLPAGRAAPAAPAILVVEDDPRVMRATLAGLTELGHPALSCTSGEAALALLDAHPSIRLLVTDVVMPNMTGPALVRHALSRHPNLRVLFVTGYVGEAGADGEMAGHEVLRKPFTMAALGRALDTVLRVSEPLRPASVAAAG